MNRSYAWGLIGRALSSCFPDRAEEILDVATASSVEAEPSDMSGVVVVEGRCGGCGMALGTYHMKTWGGYIGHHVFRPHDPGMPCRDTREVVIRMRAPTDPQPKLAPRG